MAVQATHHFSFGAEKVYDAWLTPSIASRFLFATRTGTVMRCEIEPCVGGGFVVTDRRPLADDEESVMDAEHRGTFLALDRPRRIAFEFSVPPFSEAPTRVEIDIAPQGAQACVLTLTHHGVAPEYADRTRLGWVGMLMHLDKELGIRRIGVPN